MRIWIAGLLLLLVSKAVSAGGTLQPSNSKPDCWHQPPNDSSDYELIVKLASTSSPRGLFTVFSFLEQQGLHGCQQTLGRSGACLVTYSTTQHHETPDQFSQGLLGKWSLRSRGLRSQENLLESVIPNAPLHFATLPRNRPSPSTAALSKEPELMNLGAAAAWQQVPVDSSIVTAVIDTGVDGGHPDLQENVLRNGIDFTCNSNNNCGNDTSDQVGHGTHMAGIIAGVGHDNGRGTVGVAWNTNILPLRITTVTVASDFQGAEAIEAAITSKVDVINASWDEPCELPLVKKAMADAQDQGILFVVAAGNKGRDVKEAGKETYPAFYGGAKALVVMAVDANDKLESISNWGQNSVDIAAPSKAFATMRMSGRCNSTMFGCYDEISPCTSAAAAYVSGAAALLKSAHPHWRAEWLKTQLIESGRVEPALVLKSKTGVSLKLDRALQGPIQLTSPLAGVSWKIGDPLRVQWTNSYPSSLCTQVSISLTTETLKDQVLVAGVDNSGAASVSLAGVAPSEHASLRVTCSPADLSSQSGEFSLTQ
jgi:Subtilase family